jgi:hypothetical protein
MDIDPAFVADREAAEPVQPREAAFDNPAVPSQFLACLDAASGLLMNHTAPEYRGFERRSESVWVSERPIEQAGVRFALNTEASSARLQLLVRFGGGLINGTDGPDGLIDRKSPRAKPLLTAAELAALAAVVDVVMLPLSMVYAVAADRPMAMGVGTF